MPCHRINKLGTYAHHRDRSAAETILVNGTYFLDNPRTLRHLRDCCVAEFTEGRLGRRSSKTNCCGLAGSDNGVSEECVLAFTWTDWRKSRRNQSQRYIATPTRRTNGFCGWTNTDTSTNTSVHLQHIRVSMGRNSVVEKPTLYGMDCPRGGGGWCEISRASP